MGRPITPTQFMLAKFASAFSMAIFVVTLPGVLLCDFWFVYHANIGALLMTSLCMAAVVISDEEWVRLFPLWSY